MTQEEELAYEAAEQFNHAVMKLARVGYRVVYARANLTINEVPGFEIIGDIKLVRISAPPYAPAPARSVAGATSTRENKRRLNPKRKT